MKSATIAFSSLLLASTACFGRVRAPAPADPFSDAAADAWLRAQPIICGEIRGRIRDELTRRPVVGAAVVLDSLHVSATTNADGDFRILLRGSAAALTGDRAHTRVSVRGVGHQELDFMLGGNAGYVLAIGLAQWHVSFESPTDTTAKVSTLSIKQPGQCQGGLNK